MALCGTRCLFATAGIVGFLVILNAYLFPLPDGIHPEDKWLIRKHLLLPRIVFAIAKIWDAFGLGDSTLLFMKSVQTLTEKSKEPPEGLSIHNMAIAGVRVRVYECEGAKDEKNPVLIYYHGGGWIFGAPEMLDPVLGKLVQELDIIIIAVRYRLAPEHIYPIPLDDCEKVTTHVIMNPDKFRVDPARVAIGGESAGGNLAAAVALKLRDNPDHPAVKLQILVVPPLQAFDLSLPSYSNPEFQIILDRRMAVKMWLYYIKGNLDYLPAMVANNHTSPAAKRSKEATYTSHTNLPRDLVPLNYTPADPSSGDENVWKALGGYITNPHICPLMADNLSNLPKTYIVTAGYDVLRDDGFLYAKRLRESGNDVTHRHYADTIHGGFSTMDLNVAKQIHRDIFDFLRDNL